MSAAARCVARREGGCMEGECKAGGGVVGGDGLEPPTLSV